MLKNKCRLILLAMAIFTGINTFHLLTVKAYNLDTATLRIIATGDLHGQVTAYNYESNSTKPQNGLSKLATIVKMKRTEVGTGNSLLVDAGDFLYDYTTNYFYDNDKTLELPIMKAMSIMGYDYITLGNHEFDYPWDYLSNQLKAAGLYDKALVCNTIWHDSGSQVFSPSAIKIMQLTTTGGKSLSVKVGLIGSTTNSISTRRGDYVNYIDAENNYDSIVAEAYRLKSTGQADVVIVLLHGGIGSYEAKQTSDNIGYALTKVDSIDAIVTAHTHETFPDLTKPNSIRNTDLKTGCINGKPVLATSSYARALGSIDLKFEVTSDGSVSLKSSKAAITYVTEATKEDSRITAMFSNYQNKLNTGTNNSTYRIQKNMNYHNYDVVLEDSNLYQLLNNAKIDYGLTYISAYLPEYKNIPIIAATRNLLDSNESYLSITDYISTDKISQIIAESSSTRSSGHIHMFEISGKNLREWLEYNASIYATEGSNFKTLINKYVSQNRTVSTLLQENKVYDWSNYFIFDGISYTIDLSKQARYTLEGTRISSLNKRIAGLTYQGLEVTDSQKFIMVTDSGIPALSFLPDEVEDSIKEYRDYETGKNITLDYIKEQSSFGDIAIKADQNWSLKASRNYTFLLGIPKKIVNTVSKFPWSKGLAAETTSYAFLKGTLPAVTQKINIVATQGRTEINNHPVPVVISATSKYAIKEIKYLPGKIKNITDVTWSNATLVKNNTFLTEKNGVYSILVTDKKNNCSISYVTVDLYDAGTLPRPVLNDLTNRFSSLTGKAEPNTTIHVTIQDKSYSSIVNNDGTFNLEVKPPKAFAPITAYVEASGKSSSLVTASVRKTGPDAVQLSTIHIGDSYVTGTANLNTSVYALVWKTIYVGKGQADIYRKSDFYKSSYSIVETDITIDPATGAFRISLPTLKSNMNVFVFSVDRFGTTSKSTMLNPVY